MGAACFMLIKSAPNSASAAGNMTALIVCTVLRTVPLFGGKILVVKRKICSPTLLHDCFSFKYDALLWTASTILLALLFDVA